MAQELYELPQGWEWKELGNLTSLENGDRGKNYPSKKHYVSEGIPFITAANIADGIIDSTSLNFIQKEKFSALGSGKIKMGDFLFCLRGSLGKFAHNTSLTEGGIASSLVIIRPNDALKPKFLSSYFRSHLCESQIKQYDNGSAQPNLSSRNVRLFQIPVPPLAEQERIVAKLDALFSRIDQAIAQLQHTQAQTKALFASALDQSFQKNKDRERIGDFCLVKGGKRLPKGKKLLEEQTDYPYIRVADFTDNGTIDLSGIKYITKEIHEQISRYVISAEDLYISIAGTIGKTGIIPKELDGANLTENAAKLVIKDRSKVELRYLYLFTLSSDFTTQAGLATKVVAQPKLALTRLSDIEVPVPPLAEQSKIVAQLDAISERTQALTAATSAQLEKLQALKASLLDAAFRGQL